MGARAAARGRGMERGQIPEMKPKIQYAGGSRVTPLTSREVKGVLLAGITPGAKLVLEYIDRLHEALNEQDDSDLFGTEGWRRYLLGEDE